MKKIDDLREKLFDTINGLLDKDKPMEIDRARAIADVAGKLIDSAKAETAHLAVVGGRFGSGFIDDGKPTVNSQPALTQVKK